MKNNLATLVARSQNFVDFNYFDQYRWSDDCAVYATVHFGLGDPTFDSFLAQATPTGQLGLTFGLFSTAISVFSTPAPYLGGLLWSYVNPSAPFWSGAAVMILAGGVTWWGLRPFSSLSQSIAEHNRK